MATTPDELLVFFKACGMLGFILMWYMSLYLMDDFIKKLNPNLKVFDLQLDYEINKPMAIIIGIMSYLAPFILLCVLFYRFFIKG